MGSASRKIRALERRAHDCFHCAAFHVNERYPCCKVMFLCRVLCGNIYKTERRPSEEQKEQLTAMCLGPGGTCGARAKYNSILGGGWAYVCLHRDQVFPEHVL